MENTEVKIEASEKVQTLILREGAALPEKEPRKIDFAGTIDAPGIWVSKKEFNAVDAYCVFDKQNMTIQFIECGKDPYTTIVTGKIEMSKEYNNLFTKSWNTFDLASFLKMHRHYLENKADAMKLVTKLRDYKAKITRDIEAKMDDRANKSFSFKQAVETEVPEEITFMIPIFKNKPKQRLVTELVLVADGNDILVNLITPDIEEIKDTYVEEVLEEQRKIMEDAQVTVLDK